VVCANSEREFDGMFRPFLHAHIELSIKLADWFRGGVQLEIDRTCIESLAKMDLMFEVSLYKVRIEEDKP
jgi:hypothetical protein